MLPHDHAAHKSLTRLPDPIDQTRLADRQQDWHPCCNVLASKDFALHLAGAQEGDVRSCRKFPNPLLVNPYIDQSVTHYDPPTTSHLQYQPLGVLHLGWLNSQ